MRRGNKLALFEGGLDSVGVTRDVGGTLDG